MKKPIYRIVRKAGKYDHYIIQKCYFGIFWITIVGDSVVDWNYGECESFIKDRIKIDNLKPQKARVVKTYYKENT
jgi:hypothetical protein